MVSVLSHSLVLSLLQKQTTEFSSVQQDDGGDTTERIGAINMGHHSRRVLAEGVI